MTDYQKLYTMLFNAVTNALEEMDELNFGRAKVLLIAAQQAAEEAYMADGDNRGGI